MSIFSSVTRNKAKRKANYQQFLSQTQFSVYYSLDVVEKNKINIYGRKNEQMQNVCIFIFRNKRLQTAVRRACYRQSVCVSVCMCVLSPPTIWLLCWVLVCRTVEIKGSFAD